MTKPVGRRFQTAGRTIGEGDFSTLTNLTWTNGPSHSDKEFMAAKGGERQLAVPVIASVMVGLASKHWFTYVFRHEYQSAIVEANHLEIELHKPVEPGDTLRVDCEVLDDADDRAVLELRGINQRDELAAVVHMKVRIAPAG